MRLAVALQILAGCLLLAACDRGRPLLRHNAPPASSPRVNADGAPSFVGRWAATPTACGHAAWTLTPQSFQSSGGLDCRVVQLSPTPAGYIVNTSCSQGGAATPGRIVMTLVGKPPSTSMSLTGGPFAESVSLIRCSPQA